VELGLLTGLPDGETRSRESLGLLIQNNPFGPGHLLQNPDFAHVRLRRAAANGRDWQETTTNLTAALRSGDCASDVHLEWGDVVDIPAEDRPKNDEWRGFSKAELDTLLKCLERRVEIVLQGKTAKVSLGFEVDAMGYVVSKRARWIRPMLRSSKLLMPSSDLSRVKVRRHDAQTGQEREWVLDCSDSKPAPDFWLRDGDVIEVPDKS